MDREKTNIGATIKIGNQKASISTLALLLMLASILLPSAFNAIRLTNPTPTQLLITICVSLFASVIYLWILDATGILRFRSEWVSRSVYGAAIVSVLGTSVGVYKDYFQSDKYPLRGKWEITITKHLKGNDSLLANNLLDLNYSENSHLYYGFSNINLSALNSKSIALGIEINGLSTETNDLQVIFYRNNGEKDIINGRIRRIVSSYQISIDTSNSYIIHFTRPNY